MKIKRFFSVILTLFAAATLFFSSALPAHAQGEEYNPKLAGQCRRAIVDASTPLNVRADYGEDQPIVKTFVKGQEFILTGLVFPWYEGFSWYQVDLTRNANTIGEEFGWVAGGKPGNSYLGYCQ